MAAVPGKSNDEIEEELLKDKAQADRIGRVLIGKKFPGARSVIRRERYWADRYKRSEGKKISKGDGGKSACSKLK